MADNRTDAAGQPTMERLMAEGVPIRKCISYDGLGEYQGDAKSGGKRAAKPKGVLASIPMRKGGY